MAGPWETTDCTWLFFYFYQLKKSLFLMRLKNPFCHNHVTPKRLYFNYSWSKLLWNNQIVRPRHWSVAWQGNLKIQTGMTCSNIWERLHQLELLVSYWFHFVNFPSIFITYWRTFTLIAHGRYTLNGKGLLPVKLTSPSAYSWISFLLLFLSINQNSERQGF